MATESKQLQKVNGTPAEALPATTLHGRKRVAQFELNLEGETSGTVFDLIPLPNNAVITRIELHQNTSSTTVFDIGDSNTNDAILDGQAVNQNVTISPTNLPAGTNSMTIEDFQKELWEILGYASRSEADGDVTLQARNPSTSVSSGKLFGLIEYVVD